MDPADTDPTLETFRGAFSVSKETFYVEHKRRIFRAGKDTDCVEVMRLRHRTGFGSDGTPCLYPEQYRCVAMYQQHDR